MRRSRALLALLLVVVAAAVAVGCRYRGYLAGLLPSAAAEIGDLTVPAGFRIGVYAAEVPNARQMALGADGVVFVGSRSAGKVYAVVDIDGDQRADAVHVLAAGLNNPSGVDFRDGALYVAAV
ncbi:MAG: sorbosone dehydrogenase family protein, partial [Candidatus Rokuibacteriota bacterium]